VSGWSERLKQALKPTPEGCYCILRAILNHRVRVRLAIPHLGAMLPDTIAFEWIGSTAPC
jgi:hypothetical protein